MFSDVYLTYIIHVYSTHTHFWLMGIYEYNVREHDKFMPLIIQGILSKQIDFINFVHDEVELCLAEFCGQ